MNIHFVCASCQTPHQAEARLAGRTLKCFQCGNLFVVPSSPAPPVPAAPPAPPVPAFPAAPKIVAPPPPPPKPVALPEEEQPFNDDLFGLASESTPPPLDDAPIDVTAGRGDLAGYAPALQATEPVLAELELLHEPSNPAAPLALPEEERPFDDDFFGEASESAPPPLASPIDDGAFEVVDEFDDAPAQDDLTNQATLALSEGQPPFGGTRESPPPLAFPIDDGVFEITEILDDAGAQDPMAAAYDFAEPTGEAHPLHELEELDILEAEPLEEPEPPKQKKGRPW